MKVPRAASWALWPFSVLFAAIVRLRVFLYRSGFLPSKRLAGTVISVGNLTVGGTGKTPAVLWIAEQLAAEGHRPAILTRGYRGSGQADAHGLPLSDEVALLRERLGPKAQLGVGKDRYHSGEILAQRGTRWFILDDGFQHLRLQRDADVVLLDASDPFGGVRLLPAGRLREPRSALRRADVVLITRSRHAPAVEAVVRWFSRAPIFYGWAELDAVLRAPALAVELPMDAANAKFFAFCAIGNPQAFFEDLERWNFQLVGRKSFRDHHRYTPAEIAELERNASAAGADALLCTEKDVFNLRDNPPTKLPVYACRIGLKISDAQGFWDAVMAAVERRRNVQRL